MRARLHHGNEYLQASPSLRATPASGEGFFAPKLNGLGLPAFV
jgi:hypothetical protein